VRHLKSPQNGRNRSHPGELLHEWRVEMGLALRDAEAQSRVLLKPPSMNRRLPHITTCKAANFLNWN